MDDLIRRQAAIDGKISVQRANGVEIYSDDAVPVTYLENLPSVEAEPVQHGKWIKAQRKGIISYADGYAECNKCHEVSYLGWNDKYCRNCGAKMDEVT